MIRISKWILPATALFLAAACGGDVDKVGSVSQAVNGVPRPDHVMVVVMENTNFSTLIGSSSAPYINSLVSQGATFSNSFAVTHPSEPNYLALFSGSTQGVNSDACPLSFGNTANLGSQLIAAGLTFTAYSEDLPSAGSTVCTAGSSGYARKHDPWVNFSNVPAASQEPFTSFPSGNYDALPTVSFVIPNLCDDMHDCSTQTGDTWLQNNIDGYVQWANTHNSLLILTWDEDDSSSSSNQILTVFAGQMVKQGTYSETIDHYSVLRTIEDMFGLSAIGNAASAQSITDAWNTSVVANDFAVAVNPSNVNIVQGSTAIATVSTSIVSGNAQNVALSVSGLPAGVTATFSPATVNGAGSSTLTLAASSSAATGSFSVTLTGTSPSATHTVNLALTVSAQAVNDFSVAVGPASLTFAPGSSGSATVSTSIVSGNAQSVALSASGLPAGVTASFNPASVNGAASSTLTLAASSGAAAGTYSVTVIGTAASGAHSVPLSLTLAVATGGITNGDFEIGTLAGWTTSGSTSVVATGAHGGTYAARLGATDPTNGDSSLAQTFTVPAGVDHLSVWYLVVCPDTVQYDWATATLADNTSGTTTTVLAKTCTNSGTWSRATAPVSAGHSYTLTLISHDDDYAGDPTYTLYDDIALITMATAPSPIVNGDFETGSLTGWSSVGASVVSSGAHGGTYAAELGSSNPTNGDSSIAQTFTVPSGSSELSFWYNVSCPDTVQYDWATATLKDNTTGTTSTVLAKVCTNTGTWTEVTASVIGGHSYTLTLISHDDDYPGDPTFTRYDDVTVQ